VALSALDVSRWQFGITTVYHFIFVPLTIGLAPIVAGMQTAWMVTGRDGWYRLTKFFGKLLMINFALGVATGIVQEFQFGMNWSEYSRFVGDVFGAPLALEALVAFFLESTFLGLWIFGWGRLPKKVHLATIWLVAIGVNLSAYFIITANSFMQHPVGARYNPQTHRAELTSLWKLLTNNTALAAFPHVVAGSFLVAATFVAAIACWWMVRDPEHPDAKQMWRPAARAAMLLTALFGVALIFTGDVQGKLMFEQQPMKMASAESLCHSGTDPKFSILTVGTHNNCDSISRSIEVPGVLPWLAKGHFSGVHLDGVVDLQHQYNQRYGIGDYRPNLFVTYWSFRLMIGLALGSTVLVLWGWWLIRGGRVPRSKWFARFGLAAILTPFLACSSGWVFTEMGRQPWVVAPNPTGDLDLRLTVQQGVTPHGAGGVWFSLIAFTLLYGLLAVVWFHLMRRYTMAGANEFPLAGVHDDAGAPSADGAVEKLSFAY
jgi:cytochrome d ubiquinol oxidase subunit I